MRKTLDLPERPCDCGCGLCYKPVRRDQRFFNGEHRKRYHAEEMVAVRREDLETLMEYIPSCYRFPMNSSGKLIKGIIWIDRLRAALEKR